MLKVMNLLCGSFLFQRGMRESAIPIPWRFHLIVAIQMTPFTVCNGEVSRNGEAMMLRCARVSCGSQMTNLTFNFVYVVLAFFPLLDNTRGLCRMAIYARVGLGGRFGIEVAPYYDHCRYTKCSKKKMFFHEIISLDRESNATHIYTIYHIVATS